MLLWTTRKFALFPNTAMDLPIGCDVVEQVSEAERLGFQIDLALSLNLHIKLTAKLEM